MPPEQHSRDSSTTRRKTHILQMNCCEGGAPWSCTSSLLPAPTPNLLRAPTAAVDLLHQHGQKGSQSRASAAGSGRGGPAYAVIRPGSEKFSQKQERGSCKWTPRASVTVPQSLGALQADCTLNSVAVAREHTSPYWGMQRLGSRHWRGGDRDMVADQRGDKHKIRNIRTAETNWN